MFYKLEFNYTREKIKQKSQLIMNSTTKQTYKFLCKIKHPHLFVIIKFPKDVCKNEKLTSHTSVCYLIRRKLNHCYWRKITLTSSTRSLKTMVNHCTRTEVQLFLH